MSMNNTLCRLCALECEKYVYMYNESEENSNMELDTKIASCLQIWVSREDILPKTICQTCLVKLGESYEFFQSSNKAQLLLEEICELHRKISAQREALRNDDQEYQRDNSHQYKQAEGDDNREPQIEEGTLIQEDIVLKVGAQCSPPNLGDLVLEEPVDSAVKLSSTFETEDGNSNEETDTLVEDQKKLRRRKKDPNLNDVPANPRLTQILEGYPWSCTVCEDRVLDSLQDLRDHYKGEHQQSPVFKCVTCEKQYDRYRSFSRHIKLHRNPKRYTCDICGKSFSQKTTLQAHATVHTSERPHICTTCGKSFKNFSSLYVHGRMHLPDQAKDKYRCELCEKEFSTRHTLETHRKIHTGERNFVCDICGKSFIAKGSLDYHLLSHTGDKNHVCSTCGKGFKTARLLSKHISLHTGIKPHQCDVCGKQFRERGALREHSRIHTGAMPYSCEFCGKCFRFKGILTVHRRQHTGERPYACLECRRYFTNWANYNKHMKRIHHYDTSNPLNSRLRSSTSIFPLDGTPANIEAAKSLVAENKTNQYSISTVDTPEIYVSATEPLVEVDHS